MAVLNICRISVDWLHTGVTWRTLEIVIPRPRSRPMTSESLQVKSGAKSFKTSGDSNLQSKFKTIAKKESQIAPNTLPSTESYGCGLSLHLLLPLIWNLTYHQFWDLPPQTNKQICKQTNKAVDKMSFVWYTMV